MVDNKVGLTGLFSTGCTDKLFQKMLDKVIEIAYSLYMTENTNNTLTTTNFSQVNSCEYTCASLSVAFSLTSIIHPTFFCLQSDSSLLPTKSRIAFRE